MTALALDPGRLGQRWTVSAALVLAIHAAALAGVLLKPEVLPAAAEPPAAILLELAPLPVAPPAKPVELPPGPEQVEAPPPLPPAPVPEPEPEPVPEPELLPPPPEEKAEVVLPKPPPPRPRIVPLPEPVARPPEPVREVARPPEPAPAPQPPAPATTAPPVAPASAAIAAAPAPAASAAPADAVRTWQSYLLAHLERHKRYPREAQWRRQQGVAHLHFTMDREGHVLAARVGRSAGHGALDDEALALIRRAEPLPKPPAEMAGHSVELVVPIQFFLR